MIAMNQPMMKQTTIGNNVDPAELWYVPNPHIRTTLAARKAAGIADRLLAALPLDAATEEHGLFTAMHTCAFQAVRRTDHARQGDASRARWIRRWQALRAYLVEQNMGLVYSVQQRYATELACHDKDDLLSEAMLGLVLAIRRFNPWKGFKFSTYAYNVITRALMRRRKYECHYHERFPFTHDVPFERSSRREDLHTELCLERLRDMLDKHTPELNTWESEILAQRFPRDLQRRRSLREIGQSYGVSKERIRQIEKRVLIKLRRILEQDSLC